jgi:transposase
MNQREERGVIIAAMFKLSLVNGHWIVPSQTASDKRYRVDVKAGTCTCPDHAETGSKCKHVYAVEFTMRREQKPDGTVTETATMTFTKKKLYKQDWPNYNLAQTNERRHFHALLADLCSTVPEPALKNACGRGRHPLPICDRLFAACLKVYSLTSARRFNGALEEAHEQGFISRVPHFNSVLNVFDREDTTPILKTMISTSALPLSAVETKFAIDSTGFGTTKYASWFDAKYHAMKTEQIWVKAHIATGVRTNIIVAANIDHKDAGDSPQLPSLVNTAAQNGFTIGEVSADKAYPSVSNFEAVESVGGKFWPMFREGTTGKAGGAFEKAFHFFSLHRDEYLAHYHLRSNVESTFSMIKRTLGDMVLAKNETAQRNEVYAKFVAHNLRVLIAEMYAQGIDPTFGKKREEPQAPQALRILQMPGS